MPTRSRSEPSRPTVPCGAPRGRPRIPPAATPALRPSRHLFRRRSQRQPCSSIPFPGLPPLDRSFGVVCDDRAPQFLGLLDFAAAPEWPPFAPAPPRPVPPLLPARWVGDLTPGVRKRHPAGAHRPIQTQLPGIFAFGLIPRLRPEV